MIMEETIKKRVSTLIIDLIHQFELSNVKLSILLNCNRNTVDNHRRKAHMPRLSFITKLATNFSVNLDWVYFGEGGMYLGAEPEVLSAQYTPLGYDSESDGFTRLEELAESVAEPPPTPDAIHVVSKREQILDALEKTAKILTSETTYASYLFSNIEYLDSAIEAEERRVKIARDLDYIRSEAASLSSRVSSLTNRASRSKRKKRQRPSKKKKNAA